MVGLGSGGLKRFVLSFRCRGDFLAQPESPFLNASLLSVLILLTAAGGLARILSMKRRGRRELMAKKIEDLEAKLAALASLKK